MDIFAFLHSEARVGGVFAEGFIAEDFEEVDE